MSRLAIEATQGVTDLVEAIRFYANGSITMTRLDAVMAALPESPDHIW